MAGKTAGEKAVENNEAGYVFTINYNMGDGKQAQVVGNFARNASEREMGLEMDKLSRVLARQRVLQLEIPATSGSLKAQAAQADEYERQITEVLDRNKGKERLQASEQNALQNLRENLRKIREDFLPAGKEHLDSLVELAKLPE